jgi:23S rRNA (adenine2503-C2)-methyltransferase
MNEQRGFAIGARHITVSTCGLVDGIKRYAEEGIQINLAISLHAPNDEIRKKIMPIANRYSTWKNCSMAVHYYIDKAGRRVTFEYIMIKGSTIRSLRRGTWRFNLGHSLLRQPDSL